MSGGVASVTPDARGQTQEAEFRSASLNRRYRAQRKRHAAGAAAELRLKLPYVSDRYEVQMRVTALRKMLLARLSRAAQGSGAWQTAAFWLEALESAQLYKNGERNTAVVL
jgi:hypothetical protein